MIRRAIVRPPGRNFADGLTTVDLGVPELALTLAQHEAYCRALESCGVEVVRLPVDEQHPDSTFVEDTAVLTPKLAVFTRPGAASRMGEVEGIRDAVERYFAVTRQIEAPGTVDGGDICEAGTHFFLGISQRTNEAGAEQLAAILHGEGYTTSTVDVRGMTSILHLKSGIAYLDGKRLVVMEEMAKRVEFRGWEVIAAPAEDTYACNCLLVNGKVLIPEGYPRLTGELQHLGYETLALAMSEFRKMDGGLSCLSLRF